MRFYLSLFACIVLCLSITNNLESQTCVTEELHKLRMQNDPEYRDNYIESKKRVQTIIAKNAERYNRAEDDIIYTIPVVVHVIHAGQPVGTGANITDFQVLSAIKGLNDKYSNIVGAGVDTKIRFCLASTDPEGCPTNGIIRVDGSVIPKYKDNGVGYSDTIGAPDQTIKDLSKWPVDQYYNIWVVNEIYPNGIAGYAYYPNGNPYDGTVCVYKYFKYDDKTLAHELGHGLFLKHTFDGDSGDEFCPENNDCKFDGDMICDTPPHKQNDCGDENPCGLYADWNNSRFNYMSYCFPDQTLVRFTANQKARMRAVLLDDIRNPLLHSSGCLPSSFNTLVSTSVVKCVGECNGSIDLSPNCPGDYTYQWNNGATSKAINNLCKGSYTVTITNELKFTTVLTVEVTENPLPVVDAGQDVNINPGSSVKLGGVPTAKGKGPFTYKWSPSTGLNFGTIANPIAAPDSTTKYFVSVTDGNGCTSIDSILVSVNTTSVSEEYKFSKLKVYPNPANDLINLQFSEIPNGAYTVNLKNLLGQIIYTSPEIVTDHTLNKKIPLATLPQALYMMEIVNGPFIKTIKVQKLD